MIFRLGFYIRVYVIYCVNKTLFYFWVFRNFIFVLYMKLTRNYRNMNKGKGKAKKNTKGNKRFTKRRHCGRKKNTRNLPKK